jgi:hypothetical protein
MSLLRGPRGAARREAGGALRRTWRAARPFPFHRSLGPRWKCALLARTAADEDLVFPRRSQPSCSLADRLDAFSAPGAHGQSVTPGGSARAGGGES